MSDLFWANEAKRLGILTTESVDPVSASDDVLLAAWHMATKKAEETDNWDEVSRLEEEVINRELL